MSCRRCYWKKKPGCLACTRPTKPTIECTARQIEILRFVQTFIERAGYAPSRKEIADHFGFTVNAAQQHVKLLMKKGAIKQTPGVMRSLAVLVELA